jgi:hypothetical protein
MRIKVQPIKCNGKGRVDCPILDFGAAGIDTTTSTFSHYTPPLLRTAPAFNTRVAAVNNNMLARSALRNGPARVVARQTLRRTTTVAPLLLDLALVSLRDAALNSSVPWLISFRV